MQIGGDAAEGEGALVVARGAGRFGGASQPAHGLPAVTFGAKDGRCFQGGDHGLGISPSGGGDVDRLLHHGCLQSNAGLLSDACSAQSFGYVVCGSCSKGLSRLTPCALT